MRGGCDTLPDPLQLYGNSAQWRSYLRAFSSETSFPSFNSLQCRHSAPVKGFLIQLATSTLQLQGSCTLSAVLSAARLASRSDDRELCTRMASTQSGGAGDPSNPRRPSLSISTAVPEGANQQGSSAAAAHQQQHSAEGRSPASGEQTGSAVGGSRGQQRNFSAHARSQSLAEHHNHHASPTSPPSAGNESGAGGQGGASDLVRRHHTLSSTSSSRLVRLERSRARLAL